MNDARRRKGAAGLRVTWCDRHVGNERNDDELQSDQGASRRSDAYVEVFPSVECCHVIDHLLRTQNSRVLLVADLFHPVDGLSVSCSTLAMCVMAVVPALCGIPPLYIRA